MPLTQVRNLGWLVHEPKTWGGASIDRPPAFVATDFKSLLRSSSSETNGSNALRLSSLRIENFRAHVSTELTLSSFGCLIGENNAGKSSVLHALHFALKGSPPGKLDTSDFHDPSIPISVEVRFDEVTDRDLGRIADDEHRSRVSTMLIDGSLTLVRVAAPGEKVALRTIAQMPRDTRWSEEALNAVMTGRKNPALRDSIVGLFPEMDAILPQKVTMGDARTQLAELISLLPKEELERKIVPLKTGIDAALRPLLPEVIYIEAVKDASAETKTSETATFGKLMKILLDAVAHEFEDIEKSFQSIHQRLSRHLDVGGATVDTRLREVKLIESTIQGFVRESFPGVGLEIRVPAPALRSILGTAEIDINDGHRGSITSKGDGLKRTVAFAILRAYTALKDSGLDGADEPAASSGSYLLLFEEPELYLHPRAQRQLFDTLARFSTDHPVLVTTHSPVFLNTTATATFARLRKVDAPAGVDVVNLDLRSDMSEKDALQLIGHENNEAALFARAIVLVEGDSDAVVLPHLAQLLNNDWDHVEHGVVFIRTGGKSSIQRYRDFFNRFEVPVFAIGDLDVLLDSFTKISQDTQAAVIRQQLLQDVDRLLASEAVPLTGNAVDSFKRKASARELWGRAQKAFDELDESPEREDFRTLEGILGQLFDLSRGRERLTVLSTSTGDLAAGKRKLNVQLHTSGAHVLERGAIERYYGEPPLGGDKVLAAGRFRAATKTLEQFRARHGVNADEVTEELNLVFTAIFSRLATPVPEPVLVSSCATIDPPGGGSNDLDQTIHRVAYRAPAAATTVGALN
ncbi:ATP-dependent nuclease [Mycetocola sp.]|uniref:ATP-dependent nuclease n=1 Tax=Mycetocola sp. TaxID=1871042 RepID=UPI0039899006